MKARRLASDTVGRDRDFSTHGIPASIPSLLPDPFDLPRKRREMHLTEPRLIVKAVEHIRRMRGGSQSHLMRCSDGFCYVVKFQDNPQHNRTLVNDYLGTALALRLGLPTSPFAIVDVGEQLIHLTTDLCMRKGDSCRPCLAGLQYGSRFVGDPTDLSDAGFLPDVRLDEVENLQDFLGMYVFDKWTCNTDGRQTLFNRIPGQFHFRVTMIDQGWCFNAEAWNFPDRALGSIYWRRHVYDSVKSLTSFEPWINRLEQDMNLEATELAANQIPSEWFNSDHVALHHLLERLDRRRLHVRRLIEESLDDPLHVFPNYFRR